MGLLALRQVKRVLVGRLVLWEPEGEFPDQVQVALRGV